MIIAARTSRPLRIGYIPLLDAAPIVVGAELGFFAARGIQVKLLRQPGWASVREKVVFGELDAAHAPAGLLLAINAEQRGVHARCLTGFILNQEGNAITLSKRLCDEGIRDLADLADYACSRRSGTTLTMAVVSRYSSHAYMLSQWLRQGGISPERQARIVVLPPTQMAPSIASGHIDGFCVGEPWNTVSTFQSGSWIAEHGRTLAPSQIEKVLMVRRDFAEERSADHLALIGALSEAAAWCGVPSNRRELAKILNRAAFPTLTPKLIEQSLRSDDAPVFRGAGLHRPLPEDAAWLVKEMLRHGLLSGAAVAESIANESFRADLYDLALSTPKTKKTKLSLV